MTIAQYICEALAERNKIVVPVLGTFTAEPSASAREAFGTVVTPPSRKVIFSEELEFGFNYSLVGFIAEKESEDAESIEATVKQYVEELREQLRQGEQAVIRGLGTIFADANGRLRFEQDQSTNLEPASFGLPKLKVVPVLQEQTGPIIADQTEKKSHGELLMWIILVPLVLLAIFFVYLFTNPEAVESFKQMAGLSPKTEVPMTGSGATNLDSLDNADVEEPSAKPSTTPAKTDKPANTKPETGKPADKPKDKPADKPAATTPAKPADKPTATAATVGTNGIVTQKSNRWYVQIGAFRNAEGAKKAANEAKAKGYPEAKVVQFDDFYRVSIGDFGDKEAAVKFGQEAQKDYASTKAFKF